MFICDEDTGLPSEIAHVTTESTGGQVACPGGLKPLFGRLTCAVGDIRNIISFSLPNLALSLPSLMPLLSWHFTLSLSLSLFLFLSSFPSPPLSLAHTHTSPRLPL